MQVIVIINASAGTVVSAADGSLAAEAVERAFREAGVYPDVNYVEPKAMAESIRDAVRRKPGAIVVGGGDGTLNTAASILADTGIPLGILPLGTLNHFSKDLNIPANLAEAVAVVSARHVAPIDLAEVNGRIFINNCSLGAYPAAVRRRDALRAQRGHGKWWAMSLAWLEVLRRLRRLRFEMKLDGVTHSRRAPMLLVSNNRYTGGLFSKSLRERLDAGELWLYTTRAHRVFPLLRLAFRALIGRLEQADDFETWAAKSAEVSLPEQKIKAGLDGEVVDFEKPLRFRIRPRALLVLAPPVAAEIKSR